MLAIRRVVFTYLTQGINEITIDVLNIQDSITLQTHWQQSEEGNESCLPLSWLSLPFLDLLEICSSAASLILLYKNWPAACATCLWVQNTNNCICWQSSSSSFSYLNRNYSIFSSKLHVYNQYIIGKMGLMIKFPHFIIHF